MAATKNLLVIIIDVFSNEKMTFQQCLDHVIVFINSYLLSSQYNSVAVILCHQAGSTLVYPNRRVERDIETKGKYEPLAIMNHTIKHEIQSYMNQMSERSPSLVSSHTLLSCALSICLCYIQRCVRENGQINSRILVIRGDQDSSMQHISTMNCIFAAQKESIPIDCCVLLYDSTYLQQATDITGGLYVKVPEPSGLLQYLLWVFLPDVKYRSLLTLPSTSSVDYRTTCFCHEVLVNVGFVCSICLAVLCNFTPICPLCHTHFKLPSLPLLKSKKKSKGKSKSKIQ